MIQFEMEDVISVLQNCAPYLIGLGVVLLAGIIVLIAVRGAGKSRKFLIRAQTGLAMALALVLAVNGIMLNSVSALLDLSLVEQVEISDETMDAAEETALEIAEEGFVLLQNDDNTLPLTDVGSLNLFGWASANPIYGGTGSGGINALYDIVSIQQGLEQAGFEDAQAVPRLLAIWEKYVSEKPRPGYRPLGLSYSAQGTYNGEEFLDAEQITKNKLYIYTREKNTGFDRRFLMKRVGEVWMIDAVQERLDGWQRTGL